jgi:hypothetical protein
MAFRLAWTYLHDFLAPFIAAGMVQQNAGRKNAREENRGKCYDEVSQDKQDYNVKYASN